MSRKQAWLFLGDGVWVDDDIAAEILWLNRQGVRTVGSCSGHGQTAPSALIRNSSAGRAEELGYAPELDESGYHSILLKGVVRVDEEIARQPYRDSAVSAGVCEGHSADTLYFRFERKGEEPTTIYLRDDEALALLRVLSAAIWCERMSTQIAHGAESMDAMTGGGA
jgi:hypothetical protein